MKTVFSNDMVAHVWAQRTQSEGRSHNGNVWFDGAVLYSYRTPVAHIVEAPSGSAVALITCESYSPSTGKQLGAVRRAASHLATFDVPFIGRSGGRHTIDSSDLATVHANNAEYLADAFTKAVRSAARVRANSWRREYTLGDVRRQHETLRLYCGIFAVAPVKLHDVQSEATLESALAEISAAWAQADARNADPKTQAKRERERERRAEREAEKQAAKNAATLARQAAERAQGQESLAAWLNGENVFLPNIVRTTELGGVYLRISGNILQTSQGAEVPLDHAKRIFKLVAAWRRRDDNEIWRARPDAPERVGHFTVDTIYPDGSFRAGCHKIEWPQIEQAARLVGLIPPEVLQGDSVRSTKTESV